MVRIQVRDFIIEIAISGPSAVGRGTSHFEAEKSTSSGGSGAGKNAECENPNANPRRNGSHCD